MIPRYPFITIVHYRAEVKRPIVTRQFDTLAAAFAMREENLGRKDVYKIIVCLELDVAEGGGTPSKY
jgi:hypothetical protein